MRKILPAILSTVLIAGTFGIAYAVSSYRTTFNNTYGTTATVLNTCVLCHPAGGGNNASNLNNFAIDFSNNGNSYIAIENLDSDADGFTNITEINARTFPGDAASHPATGDTTLPVISEFVLPLNSTSLTVNISTFSATDNVGVIGYMVTETATVPDASASGWSGVKPQSYNFGSTGAKMLYAWAKDAAGNISAPLSAVTTIAINPMIYASFGSGNGLWQFDAGGVSKQISAAAPTDMTASGSLLFTSVPGFGLYQWNGAASSQINNVIPTNMALSGSVLYATFAGYSNLYKWDGAKWSQINNVVPTSMVASGSILYANYGAAGLWKWDDAKWSRINTAAPTNMVASGSTLYATFPGYSNLYKWDGSKWAKINNAVPISMIATGSILYANYGAAGLWKWDGIKWSRLNTAAPTSMVAFGSTLYATFTGYSNLYEWDGSKWNQINNVMPTSMVASAAVLYADYGTAGLWKWASGQWSKLSTMDPAIIVAGF